ncbi:MAG: ABC transporter permease [Clostridia bacterium]|nr:ABC transporter permease [Clostridia bacterium]
MKIKDIFSMALGNLMRRKLRTFLTVIGVIVGAAAIIVMISLGIAMNKSLDDTISEMGDLTIIELNTYAYTIDDNGNYQDKRNLLNDELVEKIKKLDGVVAVSPFVSVYENKIVANRTYELQGQEIYGIDAEAFEQFGYELEYGDFPKKGETFLFFGTDTYYRFRNPDKPVYDYFKEFYNTDGTPKPPKVDIKKAKIYISGFSWNDERKYEFKKYNVQKVGILKQKENDWMTQYSIFADIETVNKILSENAKANNNRDFKPGEYNTVKIKAADINSAEKIQNTLKEMGITTYGLSDMRESMQKQQGTLQMILGGIGAMSLIVAAIGIANTMVMSIYERTKEIGVMKVLGCKLSNIKSMFLIESSVIGFIGGIFGVALSYVASFLMNKFMNASSLGSAGNFGIVTESAVSIIPWWLVLLSVVFSTVVGLISGYLPSCRATRISALEAIKSE